MKPVLLKITNTPDHSFSIEEHKGRAFNYPYHFHPEYELTLIVKGKGTRFVGNNISSFDPKYATRLGNWKKRERKLPNNWLKFYVDNVMPIEQGAVFGKRN